MIQPLIFLSPNLPILSVRTGQVQQNGDKKCHLSFSKSRGKRDFIFNIKDLNKTVRFGIENAINYCKVQ